MKKLTFVFLLVFASTAFSESLVSFCEKRLGMNLLDQEEQVKLIGSKTCVVEDMVLDKSIDLARLEKFIELEKSIGVGIYNAHHISDIKIYAIRYGHMFLKRFVRLKELENVVYFAAEKLGIIPKDELFQWPYDQLDTYRDIEELTPEELRVWLSYKFIDGQSLLSKDSEELVSFMGQILERERIFDTVVDDLIKILFTESSEKLIAIYPINHDDGNNENAQWALIGKNQIILMNKNFWL